MDTDGELGLSVIVPARDEARSLRTCLASLAGQSEPGFALGAQWELIVVDDASSDETRSIAEGFPDVTVLTAPALDLSERGQFTGKNNACWDTTHEPGDLSRSLREAERHDASLLSYSPRQIVTGLWQRAVMPLVFSELASVYPSRQVNDPGNRLAAANGQYLLVERDAYFAVGGHRAIGREVLEDVALARNVKRSGRAIRFRYAPEAVAARMYWTTGEMVEGWRKNLALLMPSPVALALWRALDFALFFGLPVAAMLVPPKIPYQDVVFFLLWVRTAFRFYNRAMRAHFPVSDTILSVLGIPFFCYLLVRSVLDHRIKKEVRWKGRSYKAGGS